MVIYIVVIEFEYRYKKRIKNWDKKRVPSTVDMKAQVLW